MLARELMRYALYSGVLSMMACASQTVHKDLGPVPDIPVLRATLASNVAVDRHCKYLGLDRYAFSRNGRSQLFKERKRTFQPTTKVMIEVIQRGVQKADANLAVWFDDSIIDGFTFVKYVHCNKESLAKVLATRVTKEVSHD